MEVSTEKSKIMFSVILSQLKVKAEKLMVEEKHLQVRHQCDPFNNFLDFKEFDKVWHASLWQVPTSFITDKGLVQAIQALHENSSCAVLLDNQLGQFFKTTVESIMDAQRACRKHSVTTTHPSSLVEGPYATYDLPMTLILRVAAMVNFKTSPKDS